MKKITIIFIFSVFTLFIYAQTNELAYMKSDSLSIEVERITSLISKLDDSITTPYYFDYIHKQYEDRFEKLTFLLSKLEKIEKEFVELSSINIYEIDYYLKLAYINIAFLNVYGNKDLYIGYKKIKNKDLYEKISSKWDDLKKRNLNYIESRLEKIQRLDTTNYEINIIKSIVFYYNGEIDEAIKGLNGIAYKLQNMTNEMSEIETSKEYSLLTYIYSWLTYISIRQKDLLNAKKQLSNSRSFGSKTNSFINDYNDRVNEKLLSINHTYCQLYLEDFKTIDYLEKYQTKKKFNSIEINSKIKRINFELIKDTIYLEPKYISNLIQSAWTKLTKLEQQPWNYVNNAFMVNDKELYKKNSIYYEKITSANEGGSSNNISMHLSHIKEFSIIYNDFIKAKFGLNELIEQNPDILIYRILRLKANFGLNYIYEAFDNYYIDIFNFIEVDGNKIPDALIDEISKYFFVNNLLQMEDDIYFSKELEKSFLTDMIELEFTTLIRDSDHALKTISGKLKEIDKTAYLYNYKLISLLEIYKSFVEFKQGYPKIMSKSLIHLENNPELSEWYEFYKTRTSVIIKEYKFEKKEKK